MGSISEDTLLSFRDELRKLGWSPAMGATATGAALGAGWQGLSGYNDARAQGQGVGDSLLSGLRRGAIGGAVGGAVGAGAGYGLSRLSGRLGNVGRRVTDSLDAVGKHQFHVMTGVGKASDYGMGAAETAGRRAAAASKELEGMAPGSENRFFHSFRQRREQAATAAADTAHANMQEAERRGLTSIPGIVGGLAGKDRKENARLLYRTQFGDRGMLDKALMVGAPLAVGGLAAATAPNAEEAGAQTGGVLAGSVAGMPFGVNRFVHAVAPWGSVLPSNLVTKPFEYAGQVAGRGVGRAVGYLRRPQENT